jgi:uncharacterized membrane protein YjdF
MTAADNARAPDPPAKAAMLLVASAGSAASVLIAVFVAPPGNGYRVAPVFLVPLIWIVWALRRRLCLTPLTYAAFVAAVLLHNFGGARGMYQTRPLGVNFDVYVHSYFGFVGGLLIHRIAGGAGPASVGRWMLALVTVLLVMGCGALHELMEYASTLALGPERGMLKSEQVSPFDTQRDLLSNLCGVTTAAVLMSAIRGRRRGPAVAGPAAQTIAAAPRPTV